MPDSREGLPAPSEAPEQLRERLRRMDEPAVLRLLAEETEQAERTGTELSPERVAVFYEVLDEVAPLAPAPVNFQASWKRFRREHPEAFPEAAEKRRLPRRWRLAAVTAAALLLFATASAADLPGAVFVWGQDVLMVEPPSGSMTLPETEGGTSLAETLRDHGFEIPLPTWIPAEYQLDEISMDEDRSFGHFTAVYRSDDPEKRPLFFRVYTYQEDAAPKSAFERDEDGKVKHYTIQGYPAVSYTNARNRCFVWCLPGCMVQVSGELSQREMDRVIRSIPDES